MARELGAFRAEMGAGFARVEARFAPVVAGVVALAGVLVAAVRL